MEAGHSAGIANITDFCPDWSYTEVSVPIWSDSLVIMHWLQSWLDIWLYECTHSMWFLSLSLWVLGRIVVFDKLHLPTDCSVNEEWCLYNHYIVWFVLLQGGCKVLVTGPWYAANSSYSVSFGMNTVPATLVQSGVLRCFSPGTLFLCHVIPCLFFTFISVIGGVLLPFYNIVYIKSYTSNWNILVIMAAWLI